MWFLATWAGRIVASLIVLALVPVVVGVVLFATDYAVEATVTQKQCGLDSSTVTVKTKVFGITHRAPVAREQCLVVPPNAFVEYHVRSQRTVIYETEGGACIWDTGKVPGHPCT